MYNLDVPEKVSNKNFWLLDALCEYEFIHFHYSFTGHSFDQYCIKEVSHHHSNNHTVWPRANFIETPKLSILRVI